MIKQKSILFFIILFIIFCGGYSWYFFTHKEKETVHYHAGFLVYINGVAQDYSDIRYQHINPCNAPGVRHEEDEQEEKAHLHDNTGDVAHVHRNNAKWNDLFINTGATFPQDLPVVGYTQDEKIDNFLSSPILPYQSVVVVVGDQTGKELDTFVTRSRIEEVEGRSETCGS